MSSTSILPLEYQKYERHNEYMTFGPDQHPFRNFRMLNKADNTWRLEFFIPKEIFSISGIKFLHFRPQLPDIIPYHLDMMDLFSYIIYTARSILDGTLDETKSTKATKAKKRNDGIVEEEEEIETAKQRLQKEEDLKNGIVSLFDVVPHAMVITICCRIS
jgi:hypothetical protein